MPEIIINRAETTTAAQISSTANTMTLTDVSSWRDAAGRTLNEALAVAGAEMRLTLVAADDEDTREIVRVTATSGNGYAILRAQENTTARDWPSGTKVFGNVTAGGLAALVAGDDLPDALAHINKRQATKGTAYSLTLPAVNPNAGWGSADVTYTLTGLPSSSGLNFNSLTRVLSGTPQDVANYTLTYHASNGTQEAAQTFTLAVVAPAADPSTISYGWADGPTGAVQGAQTAEGSHQVELNNWAAIPDGKVLIIAFAAAVDPTHLYNRLNEDRDELGGWTLNVAGTRLTYGPIDGARAANSLDFLLEFELDES